MTQMFNKIKTRNSEHEAQILFLKYAFPCAGITLARGHINIPEYNKLEKAAVNNQPIDWPTLQRIFSPAWRRINIIANQINQNSYHIDTIRRYYLKFHNQFIRQKEGSYKYAPSVLCDLCRVKKAKIIDVKVDCYLVQINSNKKRAVAKSLYPNAKKGDLISVHYGYAIEKLKTQSSSAESADKTTS